jgi:hypothetical protein
MDETSSFVTESGLSARGPRVQVAVPPVNAGAVAGVNVRGSSVAVLGGVAEIHGEKVQVGSGEFGAGGR